MSRDDHQSLAASETWHLGIHHLATEPVSVREVKRNGVKLQALVLEPWQQSHEFPVTFDAVIEQLSSWPGCYVEGDGSLVWRPEKGPNGPFLEGNLFDGEVYLRHLELKGRAYRRDFEQLFCVLGWPIAQLAVQLVKEGLFLSGAEFLDLLLE